jgi:hypothetical protein
LVPSRARTGETASEREDDAFPKLHAKLWSSLVGESLSKRELELASDDALALVPAEEGGEPLAEDAMAALAYAIRTAASGEPEDAAWAAERVYNALDTFLQILGYDPGTLGGEEALRQHPLVQAELRRQAADLEALGELERRVLPGWALDELRERADTDAVRVFG